ncbi:MAG: hypothetical protein JSV56_06155 [Methanomassiliicoccales archaeon]|nr:MAG: hypothetical protein JSV56_06155 [Methanomassiliicoccales archaeon]
MCRRRIDNLMMIARIKCDKKEGYVEAKDDDVWQYIKGHYRQWRDDENLTLLYLTKRFVPGETSLIVNARNAEMFLHFLNHHILPLDYVTGVYIFNLMKPTFFSIPRGTCLDLKRFTVTIDANPSKYKEIYEAVCMIKPTKFFVVSYIAYTFQEPGSDMVLSVLAQGPSAVKQGVRKYIDSLDGVNNTDIVWVPKTRKLYSGAEAEKFKGTHYLSDESLSMEMF